MRGALYAREVPCQGANHDPRKGVIGRSGTQAICKTLIVTMNHPLEDKMKRSAAALAIGLVFATATTAANAKGCIKGAIVGGIAGHIAGHGALGAAAGCAIGHHEANKKDKAQQNAAESGKASSKN